MTNERSIIVVTAPWCHHCQAMKPDLARVTAANPQVGVEWVDAAESPDRARELGVRGTPTIIVMDGASETSRLVGRVDAAGLASVFSGGDRVKRGLADAVMRGAAGVALVGFGLVLDALVLVGVGVALVVWAAATMLRA